jgi:DNA-binding SARP family transcriptional activator/tetratricopeptide (TPR) repeat protein
MWFGLLGPVQARTDDGTPKPVTAGKQQVVLAALLVKSNQVVSSDALIDVLWGARPPASARGSLLNCVSRLRAALGHDVGGRIQTSARGYTAVIDSESELDVLQATSIARAAATAARADNWPEVADFASRGLSLWRGEPLCDLPPSRLHDEILPALTSTRIQLGEQAIDASLQLGRFVEADRALTELVAANPLRERLYEQQLVAHYGTGSRSEALATYRMARRILCDELGVDPSKRLDQLHEYVLAGADVGVLLDLLVDRLPSTAASAHGHTTSSRGPDAQAMPWTARNDLPRDATIFTGRGDEVGQILAAGAASMSSLWAIDGMAGVGKTSLAVHAAHLLTPSHPDAQLYLDLHGYTPGHRPVHPSVALHRLLASVGVPDDRIPDSIDQRAALWRATVAGRRAVLVFDNVNDARQVQPLLPGAAACTVLITSRRRLMEIPEATSIPLDVMPADDAAQLFTLTVGARAGAGQDADIEAVVRLCGYLPLAIGMVGARLKHRPAWSVAVLRDQLAKASPFKSLDDGRLAAAFGLSYMQLTPEQQRLLRLLPVHPGEDVEPGTVGAILGTSRQAAEDLLEDLLDVHLCAQRRHGRYGMHDLVRQYMSGLGDADADAARERMWGHYLGTAATALAALYPLRPAKQVEPESSVDDPRGWLSAEHRNLLAVVADLVRHERPERIGDICYAYAVHLQSIGRYHDCLILNGHALWAAAAGGDLAAVAETHGSLGTTYGRLGRFAEALDHHMCHLDIARQSGDRWAEAKARTAIGVMQFRLGEYDAAIESQVGALELMRTVGDRVGEGRAWNNLGISYHYLGRYEEALASIRRALVIHRETGNRVGETNALTNAGAACEHIGRYDEALVYQQEAIVLARELGNRPSEAFVLVNLGSVYQQLGQYDDALRYHLAALTISRELGEPAIEAAADNAYAGTLHDVGRFSEARSHYESANTIAREIGDRYEQARAISGLARASFTDGDLGEARRLWYDALARFTELGVPEAIETRRALSAI